MNTREENQALIDAVRNKERYDWEDLCTIVSILRGEGGCPWDREQTHHTIRKGMLEECYEVIEAIDTDNVELLREELGDVLLQIVFHADLERDAGHFDIHDVAHDECIKMIHRHPHVFGTLMADSTDQVLQNWEAIKSEEKKRLSLSDQLQAIPPMLPALMRAAKIQKKAGYAAEISDDELLMRLQEKINALRAPVDRPKEALGEILMEVTALCRRMDIDPEEALSSASADYIRQVTADESPA